MAELLGVKSAAMSLLRGFQKPQIFLDYTQNKNVNLDKEKIRHGKKLSRQKPIFINIRLDTEGYPVVEAYERLYVLLDTEGYVRTVERLQTRQKQDKKQP